MGFFKDEPKAPAAPNPTAIAQAQTATNTAAMREQAALNRSNIYNPYFSSTWSATGDANTPFRQDVTLNPQDQQLLNANRGISLDQLGRIQKALAGPIDAQDTAQQLMGRLNPEMKRNRADLETRLANQGIHIGSEAFNAEMDRLGRQENDLLTQVQLEAGQEGRARRTQLLNELAMLRGNLPQAQAQGAPSVGGMQTPNLAQLANDQYNAQFGLYQNDVAKQNADRKATAQAVGMIFGLPPGIF